MSAVQPIVAGNSRSIGRFELIRTLGRGGMAVVHLARQPGLDRLVALKELLALHAADPAFTERFVRESRLTGSLAHPNIVTVFDFFEHAGTPYIAMEYVGRGSLRPLVGRLETAQVVGVLGELLSGIQHAHEHGVVHRDLKPENLLVTAHGSVKIADFGIAKALNHASLAARTATGMTVGTPAYMAPEQAMARDVGPASDLYATGVIAYELLSGRVPFADAESPLAMLWSHIHDPVTPLTALDPGIDPRLAGWVERLLAKEAKSRPQSAAEAWHELEDVALAALGPRWRRESRLPGAANDASPPVWRAPPRPSPRSPGDEEASAAPPSAPPRRRRRLRLLPPVALLAGVLASVAAAALLREPGAARGRAPTLLQMPILTGIAEADARALTARLGLRIAGVRRVRWLGQRRGTVVRQVPPPGERIRTGALVRFVVSAGEPLTRVPDLRGDLVEAARARLRRSGLHPHVVRVYSRRPPGSVLDQRPAAGARVERGSPVRLTVSKGRVPVLAPSVVGLGTADATRRLRAQELEPQAVYVPSAAPAGVVIGQEPSAGSRLGPGSRVRIVVSTGPPPPPDPPPVDRPDPQKPDFG